VSLFGVIVGVIAEEGEFRSHPHAAVDDQLVLLEGSLRLILENIALRREKTPGGRSGGCRRNGLRLFV